jgi:hypothetical protein
MEADDREARGRRGMLWFRAIFYPLALAFGVLLLLHGRASGDGDLVVLLGRTGQGKRVSLTLHGSRPSTLHARIVNTCSTGERRPIDWWPQNVPQDDFRLDGSRLHIEATREEAWPGGIRGHVLTTADGTLENGRARGTLDSTETLDWPSGRTLICSSGPVRFSVAQARR